jgi:THO complex subunit 1
MAICKTGRFLQNSTDISDSLDISSTLDTSYFAKYLTSQKLLQLQLNDSQFRRYILVQLLITFQWLTQTTKFT